MVGRKPAGVRAIAPSNIRRMTKKSAPKKEPEVPAKRPRAVKGKATPAKKPAQAKKPAPVKKAPPKKKARAPKPAQVEPQLPPDVDADTPDDGYLCGLSIRAARLIDIYLSTFNATKAYVEAGYTAKNSNVAAANASAIISSHKGRQYLAIRAKAMFDRAEGEQDRLLQNFTYTAYADPRELVEHYRGACRFCHGKMNRWQYTAGEWDKIMSDYAEKQEKAAAAEKPMPAAPDPKGGTGFNRRADPNPDCPECAGDGEGRTVVKDTRNLSPAGLALYAGVKEGKDGIEVKMQDQGKARETLAKIRKLYEDNTNVNLVVDAEKLDATFGEAMRKARERTEAMRRERFGDDLPAAGG